MLQKFLFILAGIISSIYARPVVYSATQASAHVGEVATVCGTVASTKFLRNSNAQPTFLNLDYAYPNHIFTIVIWGEDRIKFNHPETTLYGKNICISGRIKSYKNRPEIILRDPSQLIRKY